jgi:hypothetical protein
MGKGDVAAELETGLTLEESIQSIFSQFVDEGKGFRDQEFTLAESSRLRLQQSFERLIAESDLSIEQALAQTQRQISALAANEDIAGDAFKAGLEDIISQLDLESAAIQRTVAQRSIQDAPALSAPNLIQQLARQQTRLV